jgi:hypothetical protein
MPEALLHPSSFFPLRTQVGRARHAEGKRKTGGAGGGGEGNKQGP